jgi:aminopeptidase N
MGTAAHEIAHSWYQGVLASNEALYPWMDEGFADFAANESIAFIFNEKDPQAASYNGYFSLVKSGLQEPASQHSDHYNTNRAYGTAAYNMGTVFLAQLKYIISEQNFYTGMRRYYNTWKFKHPEPIDFIRIMEKVSGMQLKWYQSYFINTTKTIDYGVTNILESEGNTFVTVERKGYFPMPVDLVVTYKDGVKELFYIPLNETMASKPVEDKNILRNDLLAWPWVNPTYKVRIGHRAEEITSIEIDPSMRMADIDRTNNKVDLTKGFSAYEDPTK